MSILQIIGWESGGIADETKSIANGGYTATGATISSSIVNTGGNYSLRVTATTSSVANYRAYMPDSVGGLGNGNITTSYSRFYFRYATKPASGFESFFTVEGPSGAVKIYLALTSAGKIKVGDFAGTKTDGTATLAADTWYRIEVMCGTGTSNASWVVKVDGTTDCSSSTANCNSVTTAAVLFGKWVDISSQTIDYYFDDFAIDDSTYLGAGHVNLLVPTADASLTNWTGSYTDVNNLPFDDDTTYISSSTSGAKAFFDVTNSTNLIDDTINAIKPFGRFRNTGTSNNASVGIKSGATESFTSGVDVGSSYLNLYKVFATDPNTSSAWTLSGIDAVQVGAKINSAVATRCTFLGIMVDSSVPPGLRHVDLGSFTFTGNNFVILGAPTQIDINAGSFTFTGLNSSRIPNRILWVSATLGDNSRTATQAQNSATPWQTIQKAFDNAAQNDEIRVMDGTYSGGNIVVSVTGPITLTSAAGHNPVVDSSIGGSGFGFRIFHCSDWTVQGFTVINGDALGAYGGGAGILAEDADGFTARYNKTYNNDASGIIALASHNVLMEYNESYSNGIGLYIGQEVISGTLKRSNYGTIRYNIVYNNLTAGGGEGADGIDYNGGNYGLIEYNLVWGNADDAIDNSSGGGSDPATVNYAQYQTIRHNACWDGNASNNPLGDGNGIKLNTNSGGGHTVHHNVCFNNKQAGLDNNQQAFLTDKNYIYNNTFYGNGSHGISIDMAAAGFVDTSYSATIVNNIIANNYVAVPWDYRIHGNPALIIDTSDYNLISDGVTPESGVGTFIDNPASVEGDHSIAGDPLLVNPDGVIDTDFTVGVDGTFEEKWQFIWNQIQSNFSLQVGSPCIDGGLEVSGITDGYSGSAPDIGAFESESQGVTPNPATLTITTYSPSLPLLITDTAELQFTGYACTLRMFVSKPDQPISTDIVVTYARNIAGSSYNPDATVITINDYTHPFDVPHKATQWLITGTALTLAGYKRIKIISTNTGPTVSYANLHEASLTQIVIDLPLNKSEFSIQIRYQDADDVWGEWSESATFMTGSKEYKRAGTELPLPVPTKKGATVVSNSSVTITETSTGAIVRN